jgi:hypothetical protein
MEKYTMRAICFNTYQSIVIKQYPRSNSIPIFAVPIIHSYFEINTNNFIVDFKTI